MKKLFATSALIASMTFAPSAYAGDVIFGFNIGVNRVDLDNRNDQRDPIVANVTLGYEFLNLVAADMAVEVDYSRSLSQGEADNDKYDYSSTGLFLSLRTIGPLYAIGRAGVVKNTFDFDSGAEIDTDGTALTAGVGFSLGVRTELTLTRYDLDGEGKTDALNVSVSF